MTAIKMRSATVDDAEASAQLIYMTMGTMADYLMGHDEAEKAKQIISRLFQKRNNRYSNQYTELAIIDGEIAGLLLSYSGKVMNSLRLPMATNILDVYEFPDALRFFHRSLPLMTMKEAEADEYFINNVAVFSKFQGHGIGKLLMNLAEQKMKEFELNKCALTVDIENVRAVKLYKHLGYRIIDTVKVKRLKQRIGFSGLHRMVKALNN